jgi:Na+/H+ antiporter NhaA
MSLFIADLALGEELLESGKVGALTGSALSAPAGCTLLWWFLRKKSPNWD